MATYNHNHNAAAAAASDVLSSTLAAAAAAEHFERSAAAAAAAATFIVPAAANATTSLESFVAASPHFVTSSPHPHHQLQHHHHHQQTTNSSSSYTFVQIKREPCQVSEVTTSNNNCHQQQQQQQQHHHQQQHHQQQQQHHHQQQAQLTATHHGLGLGCHSSSSSASASLSSSSLSGSKTMSSSSSSSSSSTLTTLVKIEASSPKVHDLEKAVATLNNVNVNAGVGPSTNNSVPIGIAVARKRPQESSSSVVGSASLCNPTALPTTVQQSLNKDMNCFGIRVADLGGVGNGCGNIYFTGNGDLMTTNSATSDELALSAAGVQSVNRAPSTYWQYPNALPIESVISMSPATVGLQYSREASRGQVVLLPATAAALDPFQQAAAAFVWPSYIPQGSTPAAAAIQPPPNFIFPSAAAAHSTLQSQPYATSLQLFGSNYLTAAAAAAATAAAANTLCQHNQQQQQQQQQTNSSSSTSSINLSLNGSGVGGAASSSSSSCSTSSRFLSMTSAGGGAGSIGGDKQPKHLSAPPPPPLSMSLPLPMPLPPPLLLPPTAMKIEDWSGAAEFMSASKTTNNNNTLAVTSQMMTPPTPLSYDMRGGGGLHDHKTNTTTIAATTNHQQQHLQHHQQQHQQHQLLELHSSNGANTQALNLMRLPTPPSSATIENAAAAASAAAPQLQTQLLFQAAGNNGHGHATVVATSASTATTHTPAALLNLSASLIRAQPPTTTSNAQTPLTNYLDSALNATTTTTSLGDNDAPATAALNFKTCSSFDTSSQIVVGVPRAIGSVPQQPPPQMQDVNIQTDTPVCSEDENSSCPLAIQQQQQQQLPPQNAQAHETYATAAPPPQHDMNGYADDTQQPLELIKSNENNSVQSQPQEPAAVAASENFACHNESESDATRAADNNVGQLLKTQELQQQQQQLHQLNAADAAAGTPPRHAGDALTVICTAAAVEQTAPEDLTGLELLSNISTSTLAAKSCSVASPLSASALIRVKQEPLEHVEHMLPHSLINAANTNCATAPLMYEVQHQYQQQQQHQQPHHLQQQHSLLPPAPPPPTVVEPLGGLNLLCALAEQRIQEEVQCNGGLFAAAASSSPPPTSPPATSSTSTFTFQQHEHGSAVFQQRHEHNLAAATAAFPSMEGIELPSTSSGGAGIGNGVVGEPGIVIKRKKHKHSKSNRSASNANVSSKKSSNASSSCVKKNKKKYSKEKRKHRLAQLSPTAVGSAVAGAGNASDELDFDDEHLQAELKNAFSSVDPTQRYGKWPNPEEIFSIMESNMRMRLADINRQYRKKKRKLDEISKNKKRKKCSKLAAAAAAAAAQQQSVTTQLLAASSLSAGTTSSSTTGGGATLAPLCDYKFSKFSSQSNAVSATASYLNPSSAFLRFADAKTASSLAPQFPPPAAATKNDASASLGHADDCINHPAVAVASYKPVRLEPSSLDANVESRNNGGSLVQRHAQKHALTERSRNGNPAKERKLSRRTSDDDDTATMTTMPSAAAAAASREQQEQKQMPSPPPSPSPITPPSKSPTPMDRELTLTSEHLYRKETRVLTDMGGLFYAGIMKPLQPPDVYAITLDGERGNKSHIMSREEIFKDTILEVAPKSVDCVPIGTRLCAYWSQQYRCLYPGRAIDSETSDDGGVGGGGTAGGGSSTSAAAATAHDFVSVEFDDGDSGRIRLQNIRLLLSDYPIVEYNDNPLYSLGKQKKSSVKSGNTSDPHHQHDQSSSAAEDNHHNHNQHVTTTTQAMKKSRGINGSNIGIGDSGAVTSEMHPSITRELYAQRSEKKRIKNLKKKTLAAAAAAAAAATAITNGVAGAGGIAAASTAITGDVGGGGLDDSSRKHHKHKKQKKKHKKHHHRKGGNNNNNTFIINTAAAGAPASYVSKRELSLEEHNTAEEDGEDEDQQQQEEDSADEQQEQLSHDSRESNASIHKASAAAQGVVATPPPPIKMEVAAAGVSTASSGSVKVKTEHLDLEEETTSNLMSEVSDEVKGDDEVEHNNSKGSKIAAFLPERQLWGWQGKAYRKAGIKGRARKQFFKSIKRGKETITVGDCAVFLSTGRPDRPYIGRIESMWETTSSNKVVRVRWFYHPEETTGCPNLKYPGALFESPHEDENDVQTISHRCEVLQFVRYFDKFGADSKQYQSIYDNNDTYYLAGYYNPRLQVLKLQDDIPTLEEHNNTTDV